MPSDSRPEPHLLLCSSDTGKMEPLRQRLLQSAVAVDCATSTSDARQQLWKKHYDSIVVDLLLADQDGISFAMELRQEHPWASILVISTTGSEASTKGSPDWLSNTADHARLVFALKQAGQRSAGTPPSILHVERDDTLASLVQNTIGNQTRLFRARSTQEARIAMAIRTYDLALISATTSNLSLCPQDAKTDMPHTLCVSTGATNDPLLMILDNLRRAPFVHQAAYC